ncbi:MAG: hypothetical protein L0Y80_11505 [Ignavibacteriae bacterium]|nr:hypothetical protein [Ignavibacteriota bacterium]
MTTKPIMTSHIRQLVAAAVVVVAVCAQPYAFGQNAVTIHGVEQQREGDNNADRNWLEFLRGEDIDPIVYTSKTDMVTKILGKLGPNQCIGDLFCTATETKGCSQPATGNPTSLHSART